MEISGKPESSEVFCDIMSLLALLSSSTDMFKYKSKEFYDRFFDGDATEPIVVLSEPEAHELSTDAKLTKLS